MPTYTVKNIETDEYWEEFCSWDNLQKMLKENPKIVSVITAPKIIHERGTNMKVDDGFKEVLSKVKETYTVNNIKDY